MDVVVMVAQLLLSISILVAVHEMGHLLAAKYFGMRVEQFSIGFPPKIWSFKKGETEYAISAIPLGGFVKISGMIDESLDTEAMKQEPQPWEFRAKPAWQRLIVMLGGIIVNVIVGIMIFIGVTFAFGDAYILKDAINNNGGFNVGPVGEELGLKTGDKIIKVNGEEYTYFQDLVKPEVLLSEDAYYTVERDGQTVDIKLPADFIQKFNRKEGLRNFLWFRFAPVVDEVSPDMTAAKIGLQKGDLLTEINGHAIQYHDQIASLIKLRSDSISLKVLRGSETLSFKTDFKDQTAIGFYAAAPEDFLKAAEKRVQYGFFESIPMGTERAFTTLVVQVKAFGKVFSGVLSPRESLSGPIGIAKAYGTDSF